METAATEMPRGRAIAFGIYLVVLNLALLYVLIKIWPGTGVITETDRVVLFGPNGLSFAVPPETRYLLIVAVTGALGSYIHLATSFADYAGNRQLASSWGWWYVLRPFIGMALAMVVYFAVRGGLVTGATPAGNLSPYGVAAIAGMAGMFSKQATDKLREVFENLFKTEKPPQRSDKLTQ